MSNSDKLTANPWARPFTVMGKPCGAACNMRCDYCYYLDKVNLYRGDNGAQPKTEMSYELLERFVRDYIASQPTEEVVFTWHGGEALLKPLAFYRKAFGFQQKYAQGHRITNTLQTNGLLLNDEWCAFFKAHNFLIGISLDGTEEQHNKYRRSVGGQGTFVRVMRGVELLKKHDVAFNVLSTINAFNADEPDLYYDFLKKIGVQYIQFTPIVERIEAGKGGYQFTAPHDFSSSSSPKEEAVDITLTPHSVTPRQWGSFTTELFDEWVTHDVGQIFVQLFDATLANWVGVQPGVCSMAKYCGQGAAMEWNGDVYACDHYVYKPFLLGNIRENSLYDLMNSERQYRFGQLKHDVLPQQCKQCDYLFACNGECPKNRFLYTKDGEYGLNYLCAGYYRFFEHVAPFMDYMKKRLLDGEPPAAVMDWIKKRENENL